MRKIALLFTLVVIAMLVVNVDLMAQDAVAAPSTGFQMLKEKFIEGSWEWMVPILFVLILGLAFVSNELLHST